MHCGRRDPRRGGAPPAARRAPAPTRTPIMFQFRAARRRQRRGGTTDSNDSPPYLHTPCRRPTGNVALNSPGERSVRHSTIRFCVVPQLHDGMEARKNSILTEGILFAILTQHPWATHFLSKPHWKSWLLHNAQKSRSGTGTNISEQRGWRFGCVRAHHPSRPRAIHVG